MLLSSALHMQPGLTDRLHIILTTHRTSPSENNIGTYGTIHKQLLLDTHHDVLLLKKKTIEREKERERERETALDYNNEYINWHFPPTPVVARGTTAST